MSEFTNYQTGEENNIFVRRYRQDQEEAKKNATSPKNNNLSKMKGYCGEP